MSIQEESELIPETELPVEKVLRVTGGIPLTGEITDEL